MLASDVYAMHFEQEHVATITDFNFKLGDLMLIWNTAIKKSLNCKMHVRYLGPLIIISRNRGGAYIVSELDGSVFDHPVAAFQVIPYFIHQQIDILPLNELIDISACWLCKLKDMTAANPKDESDDPVTDEDSPPDPLDGVEDWGQSKFSQQFSHFFTFNIPVKFFIYFQIASSLQSRHIVHKTEILLAVIHSEPFLFKTICYLLHFNLFWFFLAILVSLLLYFLLHGQITTFILFIHLRSEITMYIIYL